MHSNKVLINIQPTAFILLKCCNTNCLTLYQPLYHLILFSTNHILTPEIWFFCFIIFLPLLYFWLGGLLMAPTLWGRPPQFIENWKIERKNFISESSLLELSRATLPKLTTNVAKSTQYQPFPFPLKLRFLLLKNSVTNLRCHSNDQFFPSKKNCN